MNENSVDPFPRSPLLLNPNTSALLIVDIQTKLLPLIQNNQSILSKTVELIHGAQLLGVKVFCTEQYPEGLGSSVQEITAVLDTPAVSKRMFSCRECHKLNEQMQSDNIHQLVVAGIETHVCVAQTVMDFMGMGYDVFLPVDATGSRKELDRSVALGRMDSNGTTLTTTEAVLFEWAETSRHPQFRELSQRIKNAHPG